MRKKIQLILTLLAILLSVSMIVVIVNQTIQFSQFMGRFNPILDDITFWVLIIFYATFTIIPIYMFIKLPQRLEVPENENSEEYEKYIEALSKKLSKNRSVQSSTVLSIDEVKVAINELDSQCVTLVKETSSKTFLFTAVSQFGALDSLIVLSHQTKLIWDIAHLYYQRPSLRDMMYLYTHVVSTAFITGELNDVDFAEMVQPVISKVFGTAGALIPGSSIFINSVFSGTTNAFLMLRIGLITRNYCNMLVKKSKKEIRSNAIAESIKLLSEITMEGGQRLSKTMYEGAKQSVVESVKSAGESMSELGNKFWGMFSSSKK